MVKEEVVSFSAPVLALSRLRPFSCSLSSALSLVSCNQGPILTLLVMYSSAALRAPGLEQARLKVTYGEHGGTSPLLMMGLGIG